MPYHHLNDCLGHESYHTMAKCDQLLHETIFVFKKKRNKKTKQTKTDKKHNKLRQTFNNLHKLSIRFYFSH
jgi:hypothetical protein